MAEYDSRTLQRFWSKVDKNGPNGCWCWLGSKTDGYGYFYAQGDVLRAHRFSWILEKGPIPNGLFVCHHCDNRPCVNPEHLFLGTNAENLADMARKGRAVGPPMHGEKNGATRLTNNQVFEMRRSGLSASELAIKHGIHYTTALLILTRKTWKNVA